jgi:ATP-dependent exoDNAse (exonuclease V) alpha subunit
VGESIQARRIQTGALSTQRVALGQAGQRLLEGDIVQTRRNNGRSGVENRQNWVLHQITDDGLVLAGVNDSSQFRKVSHDYAAHHMHLGYASTVYGAQGETTDRSLVGPGVDAAGLYVGLTRGRLSNNVILTEPTPRAATTELAEVMQRGTIEPTIQSSRDAAREELNRAAVPSATEKPKTARTAAPGPGL